MWSMLLNFVFLQIEYTIAEGNMVIYVHIFFIQMQHTKRERDAIDANTKIRQEKAEKERKAAEALAPR